MTRRSSSLRWRLVAWSGGLAAAVACLVACFASIRARHDLVEQLDDSLETECAEIARLLGMRASSDVLRTFLTIEAAHRRSDGEQFLRILDESGVVVAQSANAEARALDAPSWGVVAPPDHRVETVTQNGVDSALRPALRVRSEIVRLPPAEGTSVARYVVQVGQSTSSVEGALRRQLVVVAFCVLLAVAGVFVVAWIVAGRVLEPVAAMTSRAARIAADGAEVDLPSTGRGDELDVLADRLNGILRRLRGSVRRLDAFASDASHQLRTPLTRIRGELELALQEGAAEPTRESIERALEELDRLGRTCSRLLLLARLDRGARDRSFDASFDLSEVCRELVEAISPLAAESGLRVAIEGGERTEIRGCRSLIAEALMNLLHNAVRYTPAGGSVRVRVASSREGATVSVRDTGPGIARDEWTNVFERFYRIDGAGDSEGCGLGLAIVKAIAEAHGARVELESEPGLGSCFRIVFPPAGEPAPAA